ncbi:TSUP family transporter [Stutzerimonas zhaodongensis]|uniref:TSUP family transporter n=1 Tax=Stutzerimonas zhaodongensis TaxID=1176257 RepID=UPI0039EE4013
MAASVVCGWNSLPQPASSARNFITPGARQGGLTVAAGSFIGIAVRVTSVGAGALGSVVLEYLYPFRLQSVRIVETGLAHAIPLAFMAGAMHWMVGAVNWALLGALLTGSVRGVLIGVGLSQRLSVQWLSRAVACMFALSGVKLLSG